MLWGVIKVTVEMCLLRGMDTLSRFFTICIKVGSFCDLIWFLVHQDLLGKGSGHRRNKLFPKEQIFHYWQGRQQYVWQSCVSCKCFCSPGSGIVCMISHSLIFWMSLHLRGPLCIWSRCRLAVTKIQHDHCTAPLNASLPIGFFYHIFLADLVSVLG